MEAKYFETPLDYVIGTSFDEVPYSKLHDTHQIAYGNATASFADALYPGSWDSFYTGLNPSSNEYIIHTYGTSCTGSTFETMDGCMLTYFAKLNWQIPIFCILAYVTLIFGLSNCMKNRKPMKLRAVKTVWNFTISAFSFWGFCVLINHLLFSEYAGIFTAGLEKSICTHPSHFGCGWVGMATAMFCFSKCFELIDTIFIILAKRPLIFLHWYHHITVLLFCWYAYGTRASTGIYFGCVNYFIHSIMYFYYGMTQFSPYTKSLVKPFAMQITFLQLSQMGFGVIIIGFTVYYKYYRKPCYTHANVNFLGLLMYASYFVLFLQIFLDRYFASKNKKE